MRRGDHFVADVLDLTDGRGADALGDAATLAGAVLPAVRDGGQIAFFLQNDVEPDRGITAFRSYVMKSSTRHDAIERLARLVEAGQLSIRVARVYPATDAVGAHLRLGRGHLRGRLVLEL